MCLVNGDTEIYLRSESLCCAQEAAEFNLAWKPEPQPPLSAPSLGPGQSHRGQQAGICGCETMKDSIHLQLAAVPQSIAKQSEATMDTLSDLVHRK